MPQDNTPLPGLAQVNKSSRRDAALLWADSGIPVFPLHSIGPGGCSCGTECGRDAGKHPRCAGGFKAASTDPDQIMSWWQRWPDANIGGATGDGLTVIDIDSAEGETNLVAWGLPPTMEVKTSKGRHLYFVEPEDFVSRCTQGGSGQWHLGKGIDTRGDGGYVVLPPSGHLDGTTYSLVLREPATLPASVVERLSSAAASEKQEIIEDVPRRAVTASANVQFGEIITAHAERIAKAGKGTRHKRILNGVRLVAGHYHMQDALSAADCLEFFDRAVDRAYATGPGRVGGRRTVRDAWSDGLRAPFGHMPGQLQHTPDGRPYVVAMDGRRGMFVATQGGGRPGSYVFQDTTLVVPRLVREWPGLPTTQPSPDGKKMESMGPVGVLRAYGDAWCDRVEYSYTGGSEYNDDTGVLRVAARFRSAPDPVEHERVAEWLSLLPALPDDHGVLLDWLATFPLVDLPTSALVLTGKKSVGKQMLVLGLCEYFGVQPVSYDVAVHRFNEQLRLTPVVWLDEATRSHGQSALFRRLVANSSHPIEGKNKPTATLVGSPRVLAFANNDDPFGLATEDLTHADEEAVGDRLRHITVSDAAATYLKSIGGRTVTERDNWPMKIAQHVAWLAATRDVVRGERLLVPGDAARWAREIGSRHGHAGQILQLLADLVEQWIKRRG